VSRTGPAADTATLDAEIHRGPTASVWLGRLDHDLVATKVLHPRAGRGARRALLAQARRARAAAHPRVLAPLAVRADRTGARAIWAWVDGRDLAGRVARHGRPEPTWAAAIADELDEIVGDLHRRGLGHGRLTADHVLLDLDGRPILIGLDPFARRGAATRAGDRRAAEAIRLQLTAAGRADDVAPAPAPALRPGATPATCRPGARRALAVGLAVVVTGAAVALDRSGGGPTCPAATRRPGLRADVDGDGCVDALDWSTGSGRLLAETATGSRAWRLGAPGDRFVLGDWDCDGALTPGLRRESTGRTYGFDRWPTDRAMVARPVDDGVACDPRP
jgi:hypothetical protein